MTKEEKQKAVDEICDEQELILKKIKSISKLGSGKRKSTAGKRAARIMVLRFKFGGLEGRKLIIISQPIARNFKSGIAEINYKK